MDATYRFFRKYFVSTLLILVLFLILNVVLIIGVLLFANSKSSDPQIPIQKISNSISVDLDSNIHVDEKLSEILSEKQAWAMLLDESGKVIWQEHMPKQLPTHYTTTDVAKFSRWYLDKYPVYVQENPAGLLVIGCTPNSIVKLSYSLDSEYITIMLAGIIFVVVANILLVLILFWRNTSKIERAISPILQGITQVSEGKIVSLPEKGELAEINCKLNSAGQYISKKDKARSEWITSISHDIRTPLSYIMGYAGEIEGNTEISSIVREQAQIIRKQSEKLRCLISDLNLVSKLEYSMQPLNLQILYPVELVRKVLVDFIEKGIDEKYSLELETNRDVSKYNIQGDASLFTRMMSNLIQNCIIHNSNGCNITVTVKSDSKKIIIIVSDSGNGIDTSLLKLLNSKNIIDNSQDNITDTEHGLGLKIVRQIVKAHHGTIKFSDNFPHGLTVTICLPIQP